MLPMISINTYPQSSTTCPPARPWSVQTPAGSSAPSPADVDQPAAVQLALHQRLVPAGGHVREQVLVTLLTTVTSEISKRNTSKTILPHTPNFPILEL